MAEGDRLRVSKNWPNKTLAAKEPSPRPSPAAAGEGTAIGAPDIDRVREVDSSIPSPRRGTQPFGWVSTRGEGQDEGRPPHVAMPDVTAELHQPKGTTEAMGNRTNTRKPTMYKPLLAALVDIGGTLWPNRWIALPEDEENRLTRLCDAVPLLSRELARDLNAQLQSLLQETESSLAQDTQGMIREAARRVRLQLGDDSTLAVRRALNFSAVGRIEPFDGTQELLAEVRELGLRCIVVSDTTWRGGEEYLKDFEGMGMSHYVDEVITSVDIGYRKPHRAIFDAALEAAGCEARQCVFIGNSERNDIEPALSLGMRTIRVAIEEPEPEASHAHAVAVSLSKVAAILREWVLTGPTGS